MEIDRSKEIATVEKFKESMLSELKKNYHKGSILDFKDFNSIITELEYHKAKMFLAIRVKNKGAIREYLSDMGNYLVAIGNLFEVFDEENSLDESFELNKEVELFKKIHVSDQAVGQKLV